MLRILVAGRSANARGFIRRIVAHCYPQADVSEFGCGWQVLEALDTQTFRLAVVEQDLPHLCGTEILRRLHSAATPMVLIAERASRELARRALRLGAYELLQKPLLVLQLTGVLRGITKRPSPINHWVPVGCTTLAAKRE